MARKTYNVTYYNTNNLPQGEELERRKRQCQSDAEQILLLFELYKAMTTWEAHRQYLIHFDNKKMQKVAVGARIKGLCNAGALYKSTDNIREERGALNCVFKLFPEEGFPDDFDMSTLDNINVSLEFGSDGFPDAEKTRQAFEIKLQKKLKEYGA